ncbi:GGDEF domain-containing protein, partial [Piscinibacter sp.]|uniref:GGDEF domain-containing protein n=1 Tax=Piscinibacter sp. TaxID=1903157 RepID=UPI002F3FEF7D
RELTRVDPLTGLLNRNGFDEHLRECADRAQADEELLALLYIDLDHFKQVNDRHGHPVGDELLKIFAKRMRNAVRPGDAVARLGGDEFAIVLAGLKASTNAQRVADKVLAAAQAPFNVGKLSLRVGASVGIAFWQRGDGDGHLLVERADAMLYRAKQDGRGRYASADPLQ